MGVFRTVDNKFKTMPKVDRMIKQIHISDIHFGAMDPTYQYQLLHDQFISELYRDKYDLIFINGDLFHKSYMAGSPVIWEAMKFINEIIEYCIEYGSALILLQGTRSHDDNQLQIFQNYIGTPNLRMAIITEGTVITSVEGLRILCIPEMYNMGSEYYLNLLSNEVDLTIMHGTLAELCPQFASNKGLDEHAPVFNINHFTNTQLVMSGHIHTPCSYDNFYYCGSPYSWQFGEAPVKGFCIVHQNPTTGYTVTRVPISSIGYHTINIDGEIIVNKPANNIIKTINESMNDTDYYRIEVTVANYDNISNIKIIMNYYIGNKRVKFKINKFDNFESNKQEFINLNSKFSFILDKSLTPFDILSKYIEITTDKVIPAKQIEELVKKD